MRLPRSKSLWLGNVFRGRRRLSVPEFKRATVAYSPPVALTPLWRRQVGKLSDYVTTGKPFAIGRCAVCALRTRCKHSALLSEGQTADGATAKGSPAVGDSFHKQNPHPLWSRQVASVPVGNTGGVTPFSIPMRKIGR